MSRRSAARPGASVPRSVIPHAAAGIDVRRATACSIVSTSDPLREQPRRVVGAAEREQVRPAVAAAGHHDRRPDERLGRGPALRVGRRAQHELRAEVFGEREVEERVERIGVPLLGDLGDRAVEVSLVFGSLDRLDARAPARRTRTSGRADLRSPCASVPAAPDRASAAIAPVRGGSTCRGTTASRRTGTSCRA